MSGDFMHVSIDIHSNQLLDWLIDRRHCSRDYQTTLSKVKEELTQALLLVPAGARENVEKSASLSFYHIQELLEALLLTENAETNIFGSYNSPVLKSVAGVLKSYEKSNLFLAESAMILVRLQTYEIPFYRKQISKLKSSQLDLDKKVSDLNKRSEEALLRYQSNCKKYGIVGDNLIQELTDLTTGLGEFLNGVGKKCKHLEPAIDLYFSYASKHGVIDGRVGENQECLKLLKYVVTNGNTSVHDYEFGFGNGNSKGGSSGNGTSEYELVNREDCPSSITSGDIENLGSKVVPDITTQLSGASSGGDAGTQDLTGIDWGIDEVTICTNSLTVTSQVQDEDGGIDFGSLDIPTDSPNSCQIDFAIEVVGDSEDISFNNSSVSSAQLNKKTRSLFEAQDTRLAFLNNIEELRCFLLVRKLELEQSSDASIFVQSNESMEQVDGYLNVANDIIQSLTNQKTRDLLIMLNDCSHIEKIADELLTKKKLCGQLKLKAESLQEALYNAAKEEQSLRPVKAKLEEDSNYLKRKMEQSISHLYKGRPVSIILTQ